MRNYVQKGGRVAAWRCPSSRPTEDPGPDFAGLLRRPAGARRRRCSPGRHRPRPRASATAPPWWPCATPTAWSWPATAGPPRGNAIAHRAMEKVFPADRFSAVAIAGAAGHGRRDGPALPDPARALREGRGRRPQPRGQGQPARPRWCASTCPWPCRASPWSRSSPASTWPAGPGRIFTYDVTGGHYEETDLQRHRLGRARRPHHHQARLPRGPGTRRGRRAGHPVALRGGRRGLGHRRSGPDPRHLPAGRHRHRRRASPRSPRTRWPSGSPP